MDIAPTISQINEDLRSKVQPKLSSLKIGVEVDSNNVKIDTSSMAKQVENGIKESTRAVKVKPIVVDVMPNFQGLAKLNLDSLFKKATAELEKVKAKLESLGPEKFTRSEIRSMELRDKVEPDTYIDRYKAEGAFSERLTKQLRAERKEREELSYTIKELSKFSSTQEAPHVAWDVLKSLDPSLEPKDYIEQLTKLREMREEAQEAYASINSLDSTASQEEINELIRIINEYEQATKAAGAEAEKIFNLSKEAPLRAIQQEAEDTRELADARREAANVPTLDLSELVGISEEEKARILDWFNQVKAIATNIDSISVSPRLADGDDNKRELVGYTASIKQFETDTKQATATLILLDTELNETDGMWTRFVENTKAASKEIEDQVRLLDKLRGKREEALREVDTITAKSSTLTTKPLTLEENIKAVDAEARKLKDSISSIYQVAIEEKRGLLDSEQSEIRILKKDYEEFVKTLQYAERAANKLRTKTVVEIMGTEPESLDRLESKMNKGGVATEEYVRKLQELRATISSVGNNEQFIDYSVKKDKLSSEITASIEKLKEYKKLAWRSLVIKQKYQFQPINLKWLVYRSFKATPKKDLGN